MKSFNKIFGKKPAGERLEKIKRSPNYKNGQFQNLNHTPPFAKDHSVIGVMYDRIFRKYPNLKPDKIIPSIKTDLHNLDPGKDILIWFGHSSYFIQIDGMRILMDPVFSGNASPIPGTVKSFNGSNTYHAKDLPEIDYLLISHDHYDHIDYETLVALKGHIKKIICGLGVGSHFEHWDYDADIIIEKDWHESIDINQRSRLFVEPARHFSGRGFKRNNTLWVSYVLQTPSLNIYLGGDSGYDNHYLDIGNKYGPFDLAILENGQYNPAWPYIHQSPDELLKAARDLKTERIFPVHNSKFQLSNHPWYDPMARLTELNRDYNFELVTPMIGEVVNLDDTTQVFKQWWADMK